MTEFACHFRWNSDCLDSFAVPSREGTDTPGAGSGVDILTRSPYEFIGHWGVDEKCQQQQKLKCLDVNMPGAGQRYSKTSSSPQEDGWNLSAADAKSTIIGRNVV